MHTETQGYVLSGNYELILYTWEKIWLGRKEGLTDLTNVKQWLCDRFSLNGTLKVNKPCNPSRMGIGMEASVLQALHLLGITSSSRLASTSSKCSGKPSYATAELSVSAAMSF